MTQKKWTIKQYDPEKVQTLQEQLVTTRERLCALLVTRGIYNFGEAKEFFTPSLSALHDPWRMKNMDLATDRLLTAIQKKEKILLFGDYDVDGTTSVAMMYRFLCSHYSSQLVDYYIPDRYKEGYGLSQDGIDYAFQNGISLIITLDCGITSHQLIEEAKTNNIDFIICDHHLPGSQLPEAFAILNPKQEGCSYPFKELCGCGVAFKFIMAICDKMQLTAECYLQYLDLVAMATGADVVPVRDENRIFTHFGLKRINKNTSAGIGAMIKLNSKNVCYTLTNVIFWLAPKINAAGRMDHGKHAVALLIEDDPAKAIELAKLLHDHNETRKQRDVLVTKEALEILEQREMMGARNSSVVYKEGWHKGVLGIVASRLIETFYRPTIVLTMGDKFVSGSARSIKGFNVYNAIYDCKEYLIQFGGHVAAAGLSLKPEDVDAFSLKFETVVSQTLSQELASPQIWIDLEIGLGEIDNSFFNAISRMEPFGHDNPEPIFITRDVILHSRSRIVGENHVRFEIQTPGNKFFAGIGFNMKDKFIKLNKEKPIDIVYTIAENEWNNQKSLQLKMIDFRPSETL